MSSNPLSIEELFKQLEADIHTHMENRGSVSALELRVNSYARLIEAHPENTHGNTRIPSTEVLMTKIDYCIEFYGTSQGKSGHALAAKAFTRIIAGRK